MTAIKQARQSFSISLKKEIFKRSMARINLKYTSLAHTHKDPKLQFLF